MANEDLINRMIDAYRQLNLLVRPLTDEQLSTRSGDGASVRQILTQLRDSELQFTQMVKETLTGQRIDDALGNESPIIGLETGDEPARVLLSQFGTARESALSLLREMSDEHWNDTASGRSIADRVQTQVENDQKAIESVQLAVRGSAPSAAAPASAPA